VRGVDIHGLGVKRKLDGRVFDLYLSGSPIKRPIDRALIRKRAELLGVPEKEIAACSRSGEALRCRFLVPSYPAENFTPDELSLPCEPDWLNPDFDEGEDDDLGQMLTSSGPLARVRSTVRQYAQGQGRNVKSPARHDTFRRCVELWLHCGALPMRSGMRWLRA
jgi:hypothetical protein